MMGITKCLGAFVLACVSVSTAAAVGKLPLAEAAPGPYQFYGAQTRVLEKPVQAPQAMTRDQVKRELAAARAMGCMDVPDSQYPQPCPLTGTGYSTADAFRKE
jgi:hypothetical protein